MPPTRPGSANWPNRLPSPSPSPSPSSLSPQLILEALTPAPVNMAPYLAVRRQFGNKCLKEDKDGEEDRNGWQNGTPDKQRSLAECLSFQVWTDSAVRAELPKP